MLGTSVAYLLIRTDDLVHRHDEASEEQGRDTTRACPNNEIELIERFDVYHRYPCSHGEDHSDPVAELFARVPPFEVEAHGTPYTYRTLI